MCASTYWTIRVKEPHIKVVACVADDNKVVAASKHALASLLLVFIHLYM